MSRSQLNKIALVNTSDLSETLVFSVVQEGAAEASRQVLAIEPASEPIIENGQVIITSKTYDITVTGFYSSTALSQLEAWESAGTELVFTGYGIGGQILQAEGTIKPLQGFDENASFRFNSPREATGGYNATTAKHTARMSYSKNGLALYDWAEGSTTDVAGGWAVSAGTVNFDTVNGEQDFTHTGAADFSRTIYFPFGGESVTFSAYFEAVSETTGITLEIEEYDSSDVLLNSTSSTSIQGFTIPGIVDVDATLDADVEYVILKVNIGASDDISFRDAVFGLNGYTTYTEFNT